MVFLKRRDWETHGRRIARSYSLEELKMIFSEMFKQEADVRVCDLADGKRTKNVYIPEQEPRAGLTVVR